MENILAKLQIKNRKHYDSLLLFKLLIVIMQIYWYIF